jgi:PhnB protein
MAKSVPHVTAYLCVADAARAIGFYEKAFGAKESMRLSEPSGRVGHAQLQIGDDVFMLADEFPDFGVRGPRAYGGSPVRMNLQVADADTVVEQAVAAGAKIVRPVENQFYGERSGTIEDPFGHVWIVSTHKEDVSVGEMQRRWDAMRKQ